MDITNLVTGQTEITFAILFVFLFVWVMKQNEKRETKYGKRLDDKNEVIANQQAFISQQSEMMKDISETVKETSETMRKVSEEIHDIKLKIEL